KSRQRPPRKKAERAEKDRKKKRNSPSPHVTSKRAPTGGRVFYWGSGLIVLKGALWRDAVVFSEQSGSRSGKYRLARLCSSAAAPCRRTFNLWCLRETPSGAWIPSKYPSQAKAKSRALNMVYIPPVISLILCTK